MNRLQFCTEAVKVIKEAILQSQYRAASIVNKEQLSLYYGIGKYVSVLPMSEKPDGDAKHPRPGCTPSLPKIGSVIARDVRHLRRGSARSLPPVFSDIDIQTVRHKKESGTIAMPDPHI